MEDRIRILLVEDDSDWIKAMTSYLNGEDDLLVVGAAMAADEAVRLARTLDFDVALVDIQLAEGGSEGIRAAADLLDVRPVRVIMLTSMNDEHTITRAFTAGAVNYIEKSRFRDIPQAIRAACRQPGPMDALLKEFARLKREEQLSGLTPAEREVFEHLEAGYTQAEIERKLFKTESTLKNQVGKILKKLGVRTSKQAVDKVRRRGIDSE
ncbi:response regulator [Cohnella zeiphila]|uniref:Response regulator transcription factor n=1 Tax=Cohnella zeiphila TaxID=2761120 RepID=A0A7X0VXA7_9BACL|nr:response regulator transcription factor [Cohnella zeiphila]MBB6734079.1 response regulator transcription factor [Cohnella zeiphila]